MARLMKEPTLVSSSTTRTRIQKVRRSEDYTRGCRICDSVSAQLGEIERNRQGAFVGSEAAEGADVFPIFSWKERAGIRRRRASQGDERGQALTYVRMGGEKIGRAGLVLQVFLQHSVEQNHGGGIEVGGLHHVQPLEIGLRFVRAGIVQRAQRAGPFEPPGESSRNITGDGSRENGRGRLFQNGLRRMALIDMLKFMRQDAGQLG